MVFFSVIIPTYNRAAFIATAINSVINQSYADWELIVVDDGSTDETNKIVGGFQDSRIKYLYQDNAERSAARNNGIRNAKGDFICFLDSDDYYMPNHLEVLYNFIIHLNDNDRVSFIFMDTLIEFNGTVSKRELMYSKQDGIRFFFKNLITPNMVCIHRLILISNNFEEKFKNAFWEDTHLWIRIALRHTYFYLNKSTSVQVEHDKRSINQIECKKLINRYKDHLNMVKSIFIDNRLLLDKCLGNGFKREYLNNRYHMFLYIARINHYRLFALNIWFVAFFNKPSLPLAKELLLIFTSRRN